MIRSLFKNITYNFKISPIIVNLMIINLLPVIIFTTSLFIISLLSTNTFIVSLATLTVTYLCLFKLSRINNKTYNNCIAVSSLLTQGKPVPESGLIGYASYLNSKVYKTIDSRISSDQYIKNELNRLCNLYFSKKPLPIKKILNKLTPYLNSDLEFLIKLRHFINIEASPYDINAQYFTDHERNKGDINPKILSHLIKKTLILCGVFFIALDFSFKLSLLLPTLSIGFVPYLAATVFSYYLYSTFIKPTLLYNFAMAVKRNSATASVVPIKIEPEMIPRQEVKISA